MNFQYVIDQVPEYDSFLTVDEMDETAKKLAQDFPDKVTLFEAGKSREGHPIQCLKIGEGSKNALCFACPHPNEPIGAMTMEYFSRVLAEDDVLRGELDFTWYIIKCIDPDGTRLNEKWFKGPFNIYNYTKHFFRPAGFEQVEWTFPISYKNLDFNDPLPETEALMKIMEETSPHFIYSLHNAGFGGAYWYITHDIPELYDALRESAEKQDIALSLGEPEAPFAVQFSPAVYQMLGAAASYDFIEKHTGEPPKHEAGTSSADYAFSQNSESVTLLTELPYFFDERVESMEEGEMTRKEAIYKSVELTSAHFTILAEYLEDLRPYISKDNSFVKLVDQIFDLMEESNKAKIQWAESDDAFNRKAKVSQIFDNLLTSRFYNGLSFGLAVRSYEFELDRLRNDRKADEETIGRLQKAYSEGQSRLKDYCEALEKDLDYSVIPIQKLIRIQLESGLLVATHIQNN